MIQPPSNGYRVDKLTVCLARASMAILTFTVLVMAAGGSLFDLLNPSSCKASLSSVTVQPPIVAKPLSTAESPSQENNPTHDKSYWAHYWLEMDSFRANIGLFVVNVLLFGGGVWGIRIAIRHSSHAQQHAEQLRKQNQITARHAQAEALARQAERYSALYEASLSDRVRHGLRITAELYSEYKINGGNQPFPEYCSAQMNAWSRGSNTDRGKLEAIGLMFSQIEHTGLLVRRRYVLMDDVYYSYLGLLTGIESIWRDYLEHINATLAPSGAYEHALWLLDEIAAYKPGPDVLLPHGAL